MSRTPKSPEDWWRTAIIDMKPGEIRFRGYAVEELVGRLGFVEMIWLMTRGELPDPRAARLLEAALVAAVDHGPQAPSIAIARMAMTCGVGINNAMASAINALGDVHGGAGEQCVALYQDIATRMDADRLPLDEAAAATLAALKEAGVSHVPGFGHRFHPIDPRAPRLLELAEAAAGEGVVDGRFVAIGRAMEDMIAGQRGGRRIPMNIDGATGVIFAELGFPPVLCRGLFILSRSVGALAHAHEESQSGERNKGPIPRHLLWTYDGHLPRGMPQKI
ncbi:MAG TPA: citryl-CoA lyase [Rhabdaerophilum sp.]|nr:citryl-CoA lyase [Rhabdaerophilum sp.]